MLQLDAAYDLDVEIDYAAATAEVTERLTIVNRGAPVDLVHLFVLPNLDEAGFREFTLRSLRVDGRQAELDWTQDGANLDLRLPGRLERADRAELTIDFALHAGPEAGDSQAAALSKAHGVLQLLLWYPILSDGHGVRRDGDPISALPISDVTYRIRSAAPVVMAVPGTLEARSPTEVRGRLDHARDFAFAVSPSFASWTGRADDVAVEVYAREGATGAFARDRAVESLRSFARLLDAPYPASRFVVVGGTMDMESSGIVFVEHRKLSDPYMVAHETAHQWFPWLVGSDQLAEPWLDESLATYLGTGLHPRNDEGFCSKLPVDTPVGGFPSVPLETHWADCDGYIQTVYWKGSSALHAIRRAMGTGAFTAALRDYVAANRFGIGSTAELLAAFRRHSPAVTEDLLAAWFDAGRGPQPTRGSRQ